MIDITQRRAARRRGARRGARQRLLRLGTRRQGRGRRRVRARPRTSPRSSFVNNRLIPNAMEPRAANAQLHPPRRQLHAVRREPEPARRAAADVRLRARPARVEGARDRARRGRRLRLEDLPLRRRDRAGLGQQARRPADQVDRRAQRVVPHRRPRPRPRRRTAELAMDAQGQLPRAAREDHRQHGRLPVDLRVERADHPLRDAARRPVQDAGDLLRGQGGVHQHRAGRRLPRRRPARGDLRRRAHRRDRRRAT